MQSRANRAVSGHDRPIGQAGAFGDNLAALFHLPNSEHAATAWPAENMFAVTRLHSDIGIPDRTISVESEPPLTSLEDDVAATNRVLDRLNGPAILVGHSYGGAIITEAGNNANVVGLVYVAAMAPDAGEALGALLQSKPAATKGIAPSKDGFLFLDPAVFDADFAGDLPRPLADFMALSQMPVAGKAFGTPITDPAWKSKPSSAIVATEDRMINPDLERSMYQRAKSHVTELKGSHVIFISQPAAVAKVIEAAAKSIS
jgi:pimeloyl-ACP methyl ester carboxylesterase